MPPRFGERFVGVENERKRPVERLKKGATKPPHGPARLHQSSLILPAASNPICKYCGSAFTCTAVVLEKVVPPSVERLKNTPFAGCNQAISMLPFASSAMTGLRPPPTAPELLTGRGTV